MYWNYGTGHALCGAHLLRDLAGAATVDGQAAWAQAVASVLLDAKAACGTARSEGHDTLRLDEHAALDASYHQVLTAALAAACALVEDGLNQATPRPEPRRRVLRPRTRDPRLHPEPPGPLRQQPGRTGPAHDEGPPAHQRRLAHPTGIETFAQIRSYLETGRKHHQNPLDLLHQLFTTGPRPLPSG